jgi:hypothetical protein
MYSVGNFVHTAIRYLAWAFWTAELAHAWAFVTFDEQQERTVTSLAEAFTHLKSRTNFNPRRPYGRIGRYYVKKSQIFLSCFLRKRRVNSTSNSTSSKRAGVLKRVLVD